MPKVLVADDVPEVRELLRKFLEPEYDVILAKNGEEAWELFNAEKPDLVLTDIVMPRINGMELCARIKLQSFHPETPVILITGATRDREIADGLWRKIAESDGYLTKPFGRADLLRQVAQCLRGLVEQKQRGTTAGAIQES